ncbi:MAG: mechanosensitive ion channel family protein [Burkholderiales bacterium]
MDFSALADTLTGALAAFRQPRTAWQWFVIGLALAAGLAAHIAVRRYVGRLLAAGNARQQQLWLQRLVFPGAALVVALIGRAVLKISQPTHLLNVAVALLLAMIIVRAVEHALRYVFSPSGWLSAVIRVIATVVWIGAALHLLGLAPAVLEFLDAIALSIGKTRISLLDVAQGTLSVAIALVIGLSVSRFAEHRVMGADSVDINMRVMFAKLARAICMVIALLVALPAVGIDLTALSVFGGALGVGLGLGLQKIASNYVSGFIILLDRSVKIGDSVTIDGRSGTLTHMTSRYVVVRGGDGTEALIPNDTLITSTVINQTYSDRQARASVLVTVAPTADVDRVLALMTEAAAQHPQVLRRPAPSANIRLWTDYGLQLELGVWYEQPAGPVASDLQLALWRTFRDHGIALAAPRSATLPPQ